MNFYFLLFDKFETLDLFGPVEIFGRIPDARLNYISTKGGIITSAQGTQILTQKAAKLPDDAVLVVPGGRGTRPLVKDADFLARLKDLADLAANVLSICTGSALLAAAGVLVNVKATSNKYAFEWVTSTGDAVWIRKARWVHDGRFYMSSGVSAGIDMALGFVADHYGLDAAKANAQRAEYIWNEDSEVDPFA